MNEGLPIAGAAVGRLADVWVYLSASPLLGLTVTLLVYQGAFIAYRRSGFHPLANPVALSVIVLGALLWASGTPYATYFEGAQFVHFLLGPATVALAVPLFEQLARVKRLWLPMVGALVVGTLAATVTAIGVGWALGASKATIASLAPKSVTAPVAMGIAEKIGGIPALAAFFAVPTGVIGALSARLLYTRMGFGTSEDDWRVRGFGLGTASHGIGAAHALQVHPSAGAYAGLALGLQVLLASVLMPLVFRWLPI